MSPRTEVLLVSYLLFPLGLAIAVWLGQRCHGALALLFIPWGLLLKHFVDGLRCPRCGARPYKRDWKARWEPVQRACEQCGWDLTRGTGPESPGRKE